MLKKHCFLLGILFTLIVTSQAASAISNLCTLKGKWHVGGSYQMDFEEIDNTVVQLDSMKHPTCGSIYFKGTNNGKNFVLKSTATKPGPDCGDLSQTIEGEFIDASCNKIAGYIITKIAEFPHRRTPFIWFRDLVKIVKPMSIETDPTVALSKY